VTIDLRPLHRTAMALADEHVGDIVPDDLHRPTPCRDWDLAALLAHMIGQHHGFARAVRDGDAPRSSYAPVPFAAPVWSASLELLLDAFAAAEPAATLTAVELSPTPLTLHQVVGAQLLDTVAHTWDVAQALGRRFEPSGDLLDTVTVLATTIPDSARGPGAAFAAVLPGHGDAWQRTLALLGRTATDPSRSNP
jgi:uncharacterized protein (TIGR03086 family)